MGTLFSWRETVFLQYLLTGRGKHEINKFLPAGRLLTAGEGQNRINGDHIQLGRYFQDADLTGCLAYVRGIDDAGVSLVQSNLGEDSPHILFVRDNVG